MVTDSWNCSFSSNFNSELILRLHQNGQSLDPHALSESTQDLRLVTYSAFPCVFQLAWNLFRHTSANPAEIF